MPVMSGPLRVILPALLVVFCLEQVEGRNHPAARQLAAHLRPQGLTAKADPDGLRKGREQIQRILTVMQQSEVSGGPGATELLRTAYEMFVPQVGPAHRNAAVSSLSRMWEEASALGAFDAENRYTGKITKGPDTGQDCIFEYITPMELAPKFSRDVANIRLVPPSKKRADGARPNDREAAYVNTLRAIEREEAGVRSLASIETGPRTNALGQTKAEAERIWKEEMKRGGDKALGLPSILLKGRMIATPSKRTGYRWVVQADVTNMSLHATEVEVECIFLGTTGKYRKNYVMGQPRQKLQMRSGQADKLEFSTPLNEGSYKGRSDDYEKLSKGDRAKTQANYRGAILRVTHAKGTAATFATDPVMLSLLDEEAEVKLDTLPKLHLDAKHWPALESSR